MPIQYVCRKCSKNHSKQEYEDSQFCSFCGSFLLRRFTTDEGMISSERKIGNNHPPSQQQVPKSDDPLEEDKTALMRAAESLRQRIAGAKEYSIISENNTSAQQPKGSAIESWILDREYDDALKLQKELTKKHKGKNLEETIPGKVVSNEQGNCYAISTTCTSKFKKATFEESRRLIISDLKVIPGIGPVREQTLKQQGYICVADLENHPIWNKPARDFMKLIDSKEVEATQNWLWRRLPKSHPLLHYLAGFCNDEDFAIIDIETLGLSERPIILLGIAKPKKDGVCTSQFLLRDIQDEPSAIWALVSQLEPRSSLITFNGRSFDIPYIKQRLAYYGLNASLNNPHFDLLHFTRRALRHKLTDCRLDTVEKYMGIKRDINIPGALVPHFYDTYLRTKNVGPLVAIVEHNKQDLLSLGNLFSKLYEEWTF